jgi:alpha-L-fucosidase
MTTKTKLTLILLLWSFSLFAQNAQRSETPAQKEKRMAWWEDARFGMFIHWGLYSLPARQAWIRRHEKISDKAYQVYFENFNPVDFNPVQWAKEAKAAGMKYAVLTTKHHEGFTLFDSKYTDYKAPNTPAKRDLVREYVNAFRAQGIKIGFYYSLIDWHHPDFTIDKYHPLRPDDNKPDSVWDNLNKNRNMARYRKYLFNQVTELLTNYGKIDILWLDFSYPGKHGKGRDDWGSVELLKQVRRLQPGIIVDNRTDLKGYKDAEDFETPEQVGPEELMKYRKHQNNCLIY